MFKMLDSMASMYLSEMMSYREHTYKIRSSVQSLLDKPQAVQNWETGLLPCLGQLCEMVHHLILKVHTLYVIFKTN